MYKEQNYYDQLESAIPFTLEDYQEELFSGLNNSWSNILNTMPTGAGKTLTAEFLILKALLNWKKVIFTAPLKALSTEKVNEWTSPDFWVNKYVKVSALMDTGDTTAERKEKGDEYYNNFNVLITTNERLDSALRKPKQRDLLMNDVLYVVFDEIHLLGSKGRGGTVEYLIMSLKHLYPGVLIAGLSATLPNSVEFAEWMNAELYDVPEDRRPIPLEDHWNRPHASYLRAKEKEKFKFDQVLNILNRYDGQYLIVCSSRARAESVAGQLAVYVSGRKLEDSSVTSLIKAGSAYHHAGLGFDERQQVESAFKDGRLKIIACTPTLTQGLNLPARNVVHFDLSRWNAFQSAHLPIENYEFLQTRGRAGRRKYDTIGRSHVLGSREEQEFAQGCINRPSPMKSQIEDLLDEKILAAVVSRIANTEEEVLQLFKESFAYKQGVITDEHIGTELAFLINKFFLNEEYGKLEPTQMGRLTSYMYLKPRTVDQITINLLKMKEVKKLKPLDIIHVFMKQIELLDQIRITRKDEDLIAKAAMYFTDTFTNIIVYNDFHKQWQMADKSSEYSKFLAFIFADDIGAKTFVPKNELAMLKRNVEQMIARIWSVLKIKKLFSERISERDMQVVKILIQEGTLDVKLAELGSLPTIGTVSIANLKKAGIHDLRGFLKTDNKILGKKIRKSPQIVANLKKKAIEMYPQYEKHLNKGLEGFF